ncbi:MAG: Flp family type IVb pilin [Hyphomicrobiaceae bacterium]
MRKLFTAFRRDDSGAAMMEYAILVGLIAVVSIAAISAIGTEINTDFTKIKDCLVDSANC